MPSPPPILFENSPSCAKFSDFIADTIVQWVDQSYIALSRCIVTLSVRSWRDILSQDYLRTVPTIVIAHAFCASRDTRISYAY